MPNLPTEKVRDMVQRGLTNEEITRSLEGQGYNLDEISTAMNQAQIQTSAAPMGMEQSAMEEIPIPYQNVPPAEQPQEQYPAPVQEYPAEQPVQQDAQYPSFPQQQTSYSDIQAIVEEILEEKWKEFMKETGNINIWKDRVSDDLEATKQELVRTQRRLEDLQVAVLGKVKEYSSTMKDVGTDMKALEKVFGKILEPLTTNIKELNKVTHALKKKTSKK